MRKRWLDARDIDIDNWCGQGRWDRARAEGYKLKGASADCTDASFDKRGARCEHVAHLELGVPWLPTLEYVKGQRDVAGLVEVRSTVVRTGHLIVHPNETGPFMLVIEIDESEHWLPGWIDACEAKRWPLRTERNDTGHWVPQKALLDLDDLIKWVHARRAA